MFRTMSDYRFYRNNFYRCEKGFFKEVKMKVVAAIALLESLPELRCCKSKFNAENVLLSHIISMLIVFFVILSFIDFIALCDTVS